MSGAHFWNQNVNQGCIDTDPCGHTAIFEKVVKELAAQRYFDPKSNNLDNRMSVLCGDLIDTSANFYSLTLRSPNFSFLEQTLDSCIFATKFLISG